MKKLLLFVAAAFVLQLNAQTTIYQETFETGNSFTMNSNDLGGASNYNTWVRNNAYTGGSGVFVCLGFPFSFTVNNTPTQPSGITGFPTSTYMHISAQAAVSSGINCSSYIPADGTCVTNESNFAKMTSAISTLGYTNVNFDFWFMCAGSTTAFGELYYSLDNGITWTLKQSNLNNTPNWAQTAITDANWSNQASLKFAFRFVNTIAATAADPSFCVDQILVTGVTASNTIAINGAIQPASWCEGMTTTTQVNFTSTGTFTGGNVYTAELSDASGSFASPTAIGTLTSTANSGTIVGIIPGSVPAGSGYRIRVVSSSPATNGSDNGTNLVINALPTVIQQPFDDVCENAGIVNLVGGSPAGGTYSGSGVAGGTFNPTLVGLGTSNITYYYVDANGCDGSAAEPISVIAAPTVTLASFSNVCDTDPFFTLTGGSPSNGTYTGPGVTGGVFDPAAAGAGIHTLTYTFIDGNGCSGTANQTIVVEPCSGIEEEALTFQLFPNPTESTFELIVDVVVNSIALQDMSGRTVKSFDPTASLFDVSEIPSGMYIVRIEADGNYSQRRLVIR